MAGMCGIGQRETATLTTAGSGRILPVCIVCATRMVDVYAGNPPPSELTEVISTDVDEARDLLSRFYYPLAVGTPDGGGGFSLVLGVIQLGPLTVGQLGLGAAVTMLTSELDGYHVTL